MVDRCICRQVSLRLVKDRADELRAVGTTDEGALVAALGEELGCATGCGLCLPFIRLTLRTGRTAFDHREMPAG